MSYNSLIRKNPFKRASRNDIRKQAEAILLRDYRVSRKFYATDVGSRFAVRAKNYRSLLLTSVVLEEAVKQNLRNNKYARFFEEEYFNAADSKVDFEMRQ